MSGVPITSDTSGEVLPAFGAAIAGIRAVERTSEADAGTYSYKYANLADTIREVNRACAAHGLTVSQIPGQRSTDHGDFTTVATLIVHESGEWLTFEPLAMKVPADPQKVGGAITYARRYALTSIFNIPTNDDDGHGATRGIVDEAAEQAHRAGEAREVFDTLKTLDDAGKEAVRKLANDHGKKVTVGALIDDEWRATVMDLLGELS